MQIEVDFTDDDFRLASAFEGVINWECTLILLC